MIITPAERAAIAQHVASLTDFDLSSIAYVYSRASTNPPVEVMEVGLRYCEGVLGRRQVNAESLTACATHAEELRRRLANLSLQAT